MKNRDNLTIDQFVEIHDKFLADSLDLFVDDNETAVHHLTAYLLGSIIAQQRAMGMENSAKKIKTITDRIVPILDQHADFF